MGRQKNLSKELSARIWNLRKSGQRVWEIARMLGCGAATVVDTIRRFNETASHKDRKRSGRPRKLSTHAERVLVWNSKGDRRLTAADLRKVLGFEAVSISTVQRIRRKYNLFGRVARRKPFISPKNLKIRLQWAYQYWSWTNDDWDKVIWSDEKKSNRLGSGERVYIRRAKGEAFLPACLRATVKGGGGSIMAWSCFDSKGPGPLYRIHGTMDQCVLGHRSKSNAALRQVSKTSVHISTQ